MMQKKILNDAGHGKVESAVTDSMIISIIDRHGSNTKTLRKQIASVLGLKEDPIENVRPEKSK